MDGLLFRMQVAVLWVALAAAFVGSMLLLLLEEGALEELLAGMIEGEPLDDTGRWMFTALIGLPLVMAGVTLLLSDRVNLWVNVVAAAALGLFGVYATVGHVMDSGLNGHILLLALATAFAFLIAGLGVVGLRQASSPRPERS